MFRNIVKAEYFWPMYMHAQSVNTKCSPSPTRYEKSSGLSLTVSLIVKSNSYIRFPSAILCTLPH